VRSESSTHPMMWGDGNVSFKDFIVVVVSHWSSLSICRWHVTYPYLFYNDVLTIK
jgi:hypothetical protein